MAREMYLAGVSFCQWAKARGPQCVPNLVNVTLKPCKELSEMRTFFPFFLFTSSFSFIIIHPFIHPGAHTLEASWTDDCSETFLFRGKQLTGNHGNGLFSSNFVGAVPFGTHLILLVAYIFCRSYLRCSEMLVSPDPTVQ